VTYTNAAVFQISSSSVHRYTNMAIGPLARVLAQVIVPVVAVLARALPAAYAEALQNARKAGVNAAPQAASMLRKTLSKQEALQILNISESEATAEAVQMVWYPTDICLAASRATATNSPGR
jgi:hypothetical protein